MHGTSDRDGTASPRQKARVEKYDDGAILVTYVWTHYGRFFTTAEQKAYWAVLAERMKTEKHRDVVEDDWRRHKLAEDPAVMALLKDGVETFRRRAAQRVLRDHASDVFVNRCPQCARVVATPKAMQCLWCGHDWHNAGMPPVNPGSQSTVDR